MKNESRYERNLKIKKIEYDIAMLEYDIWMTEMGEDMFLPWSPSSIHIRECEDKIEELRRKLEVLENEK